MHHAVVGQLATCTLTVLCTVPHGDELTDLPSPPSGSHWELGAQLYIRMAKELFLGYCPSCRCGFFVFVGLRLLIFRSFASWNCIIKLISRIAIEVVAKKKNRINKSIMSAPVEFEKNTVIVVFGASGDLAKKKTFPALFGLFREGYLDPSTKIFGYARTKLSHADLVAKIEPNLKKPHPETDNAKAQAFFKMITYISGQYDTDEGFLALNEQITAFENDQQMATPHRLFYLALPPSVFLPVAQQIKKNVYSNDAITRVIVEKPFGHDLESARKLQSDLAPLFREDELF